MSHTLQGENWKEIGYASTLAKSSTEKESNINFAYTQILARDNLEWLSLEYGISYDISTEHKSQTAIQIVSPDNNDTNLNAFQCRGMANETKIPA